MSAGPRILRNFVNGGYVEPESDATSDIISPVTAKVVATAPVSSAADVDRALAVLEVEQNSSAGGRIISDPRSVLILLCYPRRWGGQSASEAMAGYLLSGIYNDADRRPQFAHEGTPRFFRTERRVAF